MSLFYVYIDKTVYLVAGHDSQEAYYTLATYLKVVASYDLSPNQLMLRVNIETPVTILKLP